jgi:uncharacterized membrane protein YfcA
MEATLLIVIAGAAAAGFVQGLSGFAFSLVALSIWAWAVNPQLAAPMAVFGSLVGQLVTWPLTRRGFDLKKLWPFVLGGMAGVPVGIFALKAIDPSGFKFGLGLFLVIYCPVALFLPATLALRFGGRWADAASGWAGGLMGGLGGMAGSIPALWASLRGWDKDIQRGVMQAFNISMHVATLTGYVLAGGIITLEALKWFGVIAPVLAIPALIGAMLFRRMNALAFRRLVLGLLFLSGVTLIASSAGAAFGG